MLRPVLFLHRWLGVIVGLLMTIWCLSGFVMMYVDYPRLMPAEQLEGLAPLQLPAARAWNRVDLEPESDLSSVRIEMMAGKPVLRVTPALDPARPIAQMRTMPEAVDLMHGQPLGNVEKRDMQAIASDFAAGRHIDGRPEAIAETAIDQWTVQTYRRNAPLYRVDYDDPGGTQIYVSGKSGEVVQQTSRLERFWGWLGAVPHWLYPTILRQDGALWNEVVVWTSFVGCFLTATGLWVGVARLKRKRDGSIGSPYRGIWWWHHVFGLFFGILTLTWVASGLFSMNPWGFLDSMAGFAERRQLSGQMQWRSVRSALGNLPALPKDTVRVEAAPLDGQVYLIAVDRHGKSARYDSNGQSAPLSRNDLIFAISRDMRLAKLDRLTQEDSYYYSHKFPAALPVWRAQLDDPERTLLYIDAASGQLIRAFDRNGRGFRWLQDGLHRLDFPLLRTRPVWDLVVIPLLAMVTLICGTGTWMAWKKVLRDIRRIRRRIRTRISQ